MPTDKGPDHLRFHRPLTVIAMLAVFVFGAAKAGYSYFAKGYSSGRPVAYQNGTSAERKEAAERRWRRGPRGNGPDATDLPPNAVPARNVVVSPPGGSPFAAAVNAAAGAAANVNAGAAVNANPTPNAAITAVGQQAAEVAKSSELHQATVSLWTTAWQKSWPFIKDMTVKFFGLFRTLWDSLTHPGKTTGGASVNADANAAVNANAAQ